jgi:hypothetical protein
MMGTTPAIMPFFTEPKTTYTYDEIHALLADQDTSTDEAENVKDFERMMSEFVRYTLKAKAKPRGRAFSREEVARLITDEGCRMASEIADHLAHYLRRHTDAELHIPGCVMVNILTVTTRAALPLTPLMCTHARAITIPYPSATGQRRFQTIQVGAWFTRADGGEYCSACGGKRLAPTKADPRPTNAVEEWSDEEIMVRDNYEGYNTPTPLGVELFEPDNTPAGHRNLRSTIANDLVAGFRTIDSNIRRRGLD